MRSWRHFNYAGAGPSPPGVIAAIRDHLSLEAAVGGYEAERRVLDRLRDVYVAAGALLNCAPDEIALTPSGSAAWNAVFYAIDLRPGDRILTTVWEYGGAVAAMTDRARREGLVIDIAPSGPGGHVDLQRLCEFITERTRIVAVTWTPTGAGVTEPVAEIGAALQGRDVFFLVDAAQAIGQRKIDVAAMGCDALVGAGRKYLCGPRGTGLLYLRRSRTDLRPAQVDHWSRGEEEDLASRSDARRFELWERSPALQLGLGTALTNALAKDMDAVQTATEAMASRLRRELADLGAEMTDPVGGRAPIVGFRLGGVDPGALVAQLADQGFGLSVSAPRSTPLAGSGAGAPLVRISPHDVTTSEEASELLDAIARLKRNAS